MQDQQDCWRTLREELREAGIAVVDPSELTDTDLDALAERFMSDIFPILTPLAIDPAHPFPFIANRGMGLALQLHDAERNRDLDGAGAVADADRPVHSHARCRTSASSCWSRLSLLFIDQLFPRPFRLVGYGLFRVLRDSEMEIDEEAEDLVRTFESALKRRRRGGVIRLTVNGGMAPDLREFLRSRLGRRAGRRLRSRGTDRAGRNEAVDRGRAPRPRVPAVQCPLSRAHPRFRRRLLRRDPHQGHRRPPSV